MLRKMSCSTVIDIGGNKGQFALVARRCFPNAEIFSFEPLPEPAAIFRRVFAHEKSVQLSSCAIGPSCTTAEMHVSKSQDSSSLLPIGKLQEAIFPGTAECDRAHVTVDRLDRILALEQIQPNALLKIDVQGYELEVLKGCGDLLEHFNYVYVEASFVPLYEGQPLATEVIQYLSLSGFDLAGLFNVFYDRKGNCVQADFLFNHRDMKSPQKSVQKGTAVSCTPKAPGCLHPAN